MKKLLILATISVMSVTVVSAQSNMRLTSKLNTTNGGSADLAEKIGKKESQSATGSPYTLPSFVLASISNVKEMILVKYNAYTDEMEVDNGDGKIFILPKEQDFNTITLKTGTVYKYLQYNNSENESVKGYMVETTTVNGVTLLKKERVTLIPEKQPMNGYGSYAPPRYDKQSEEYYLLLKNNKVVSFPKNKKKLQELFPEQKEKIDTYLKQNDLSFKKENDMVRLTQFVATFS
ncbi:MAG: hypothetical protein CFE23_00415 [Flavobacterium sp. BFFFF1]|uniref:hypothetical protein n=1 Tax=unclassified Flavobacterium TaxID=196869 RepID=UPI000BCFA1D8|nr:MULTISPECIES: hypothetical protein [unclassified Flavobacterium]OYU82219.1 MAG: hypothetical protein CFE23_00415 [Flavobacterium sp. BFFFF1]